MALPESNKLEIDAIKSQIAELLANSKQPKDLTSTTSYDDDTLIAIQNTGEAVKGIRRADFLTLVLGSLRRIDDDSEINEVSAVNQICIGKKTGINSGAFFIGRVTVYPPTSNAHIEFIYRTL